jgi:hypothetical protein
MIIYALNVALMLAGCFLFYKLLLQRETFFPLNRFVLLGCLCLSFSLPLIPIPQQWSFRKPSTEVFPLNTSIEAIGEKGDLASNLPLAQSNKEEVNTSTSSFFKDVSPLKAIGWVYWIGVAIFGINFLFQLCILLYKSYARPFIQDGKFRIVELTGDQAPCSFSNNIFINPEKYDWDTYSQIILHEKIHIQQGHSYDIILAELALIFQWFNPFAWFYRKAMEDNLEFLTDHELLSHSDIEPISYQMSLVKVSAPNFPASLTTNYNQSILKKRLLMMKSKKSNINSTWKYLCIVPLLLVFVSILNKPVAFGKNENATSSPIFLKISNKGTWFATIKADKISIRFKDEEQNNNYSNNEFLLTEFKNLPKDEQGVFSLTREAGTIFFTGKFDGNSGSGSYEFKTDESFFKFLDKEGITHQQEKDAMTFYMVNLKKDFIKMLKNQGYTEISKNDLIPLCALGVTEQYITSLRNEGLKDLSLQDIIPLKALNVDATYVADIKGSGYKNVSASKLITLKAQGIDGEFLKNAKNVTNKEVNSVDISPKINTKTNHKTSGDDDEETMSELGMMIAKKALNITGEYMKTFTNEGFKFSDDEFMAIKSLGITPEYCKSFENLGLGKLSSESLVSMKALSLTADDYKAYKKLGFGTLTIDEVVSAKATGTTPIFIEEMKKKGYNYATIDKYIEKKVLSGF